MINSKCAGQLRYSAAAPAASKYFAISISIILPLPLVSPSSSLKISDLVADSSRYHLITTCPASCLAVFLALCLFMIHSMGCSAACGIILVIFLNATGKDILCPADGVIFCIIENAGADECTSAWKKQTGHCVRDCLFPFTGYVRVN